MVTASARVLVFIQSDREVVHGVHRPRLARPTHPPMKRVASRASLTHHATRAAVRTCHSMSLQV